MFTAKSSFHDAISYNALNMQAPATALESNHSNSKINHLDILGLHFHSLTLQDALAVLDGFIRERKPRQISFCNAHTIALCWKNQELKRTINQSDLVLADGMSIVWGARMLGLKLPERIAGPDLTFALAGLASDKKYRVYLMGGSLENLLRLKSALTRAWPELNIVGMHSPPMCDRMSEQETENMVQKLAETRPDILLVGISCPKQEIWISQNLNRLDVPICLGVGAAFDFLSGRIPRAPDWLRKRGLEWLHRLWCEPRRLWRRYLLGNLIFLSLLVCARLKARMSLGMKV